MGCFQSFNENYYHRSVLVPIQVTKETILYTVVNSLCDNAWDYVQELNKKYSIYKVSNLFLSSIQISNVEDFQIILSSKQHIQKSILYQWLQSWLGTGLLTSDGNKWRYRRKLLTPAFHFNILQEFFKIFKEHSAVLVDKLQEECDKPHTDVLAFISHFTLHIICETAMGVKLDESNKSMKQYVEATQKIGKLLLRRIRRPWLYFKYSYLISSNKYEEMSTLKTLHDFTMSVIKEQKKSFKSMDVVEYNESTGNFKVKKRLALLDLLMTLKYHGADITDEGIREEVDTFTFEGHDTTAVAISFALMLIANHRDVQVSYVTLDNYLLFFLLQDKIFNEIQEVTENFNKTIAFEDLSKFSYLELVIKESLRLYPSVPTIGRKTSADIHTSSGYFIPKNTYISLHIYGVHHDDRYFPNAEKFDPNRFLPENSVNRNPYAYIPFSAGQRNCIGQKFAIMELKMIIASVVQHFKLFPIDTQSSIRLASNLTLKTKDGVKVKFEKRT
ncbi:hypothetical protein FQR65_LT10062 [Abscondita terminalis]|nr:hypothetical protein FQR65_LT10062 [Abscondita terminalis]